MLKLVQGIDEIMKHSKSIHDCVRLICLYKQDDWKHLTFKNHGIDYDPVFKLTVARRDNYKLQLYTCEPTILTFEESPRITRMLNGHLEWIDHCGVYNFLPGDVIQTNRAHTFKVCKKSVFMQLVQDKH